MSKTSSRRLELERNRMICDISMPTVELEASRFFTPRGINYSVRIDSYQGRIFLAVQLIGNIWIEKAVTLESLEADLRIVPFLIKRPDCVRRDGRGFRFK